MFRLLIPIILIGSAIAGFVLVVNPMYKEVSSLLKVQTASYDQALDNSKNLEKERDKLTSKKNSFSEDDLKKLKTLLPDNVDSVRLIIEIQTLASPFGMVLKDVKYNPDTTPDTKNPQVKETEDLTQVANYGIWNLEFSVEGTYDNFLKFSRALENNLRIVDISAVQFSSDVAASSTSKASAPDSYKYSFKIKTYWMKN